jgi:hypothetical protein
MFYTKKLARMQRLVEYVREHAAQDLHALAEVDDNDQEKIQARAKFDTLDLLYQKLQSLRVLARSNTLYTEKQYEKVWKELQDLLNAQDVNPDVQDKLKGALDSAITDNIFHKRKFYDTRFTGNTGFDTTQAENKIKEKYRKRLKIEHEGGSVTATFSYNRETLLGGRPFGGHLKLYGSSKEEVTNIRNQAREFVHVALNEYGKGTKDKPIEIYYTSKPLPEAALQILMEFKAEAIRRGQPMYARHGTPPKDIVITPDPAFTPQEKEYFGHYAFAIPKTKSFFLNKYNDANGCAGYKLFKNSPVDEEGRLIPPSQKDNQQMIFDAMEMRLKNTKKQFVEEKAKRMEKVERELGRPSAAASLQMR